MTGKIILSVNTDGPPSMQSIRDVIATLAEHGRTGVDFSVTSRNYGWILDSNGNVRAEWRYEND